MIYLIVDGALLQNTVALQYRCNHPVHVVNSLQYTLTQIALFVTIAQFQSLILASRCT